MQSAIARLQEKTEFTKKEIARAVRMYEALADGEAVVVCTYSYADEEMKYLPATIVKRPEFTTRGTRNVYTVAVTRGYGNVSGYRVVEPINPAKSWRI